MTATYNYTDENRKLLFQVLRYDPKAFRQRRPDGHAGWIWNLDGVRRVLYKLPDLIREKADGKAIFIVEGEKDADALRARGIAATTNPGGAGKWLAEYNESLRDADVVIVADNDPQATNKSGELQFHSDGRPRFAGQDHAQNVAQNLYGVARRVRVLDLEKAWPECPVKGDISDWLLRDGTAEKLMGLIDAVPDWTPPDFRDDCWPIMPEEALHGLAGEVVRIIEPHTEADPNALLIHYLTAFVKCGWPGSFLSGRG